MPRKPAGRTCPGCGKHYVGRKGRCDRCEAGYRTIVTSDGPVEVLLPKRLAILASRVIIPGLNIDAEASAHDFVTMLLKAVVERTADHVPEHHATWLAAMLHDLLGTEVWVVGKSVKQSLATTSHADLGRAVGAWVHQSFSQAGELPLLPYFRAEAARFVRAHYEGAWCAMRDGLKLYAIEGAAPRGDGPSDFAWMDDGAFKRRFTQRCGGVEVRCVVPPGGSLAVRYNNRALKPGDPFAFRVQRCQLSAGWEHYVWLTTQEEGAALDFFCDFAGYGVLLDDRNANGKVPFAWFTEQRVLAEADPERPGDRPYRWEPLPAWLRASPPPAKRRA